MALTGRTPPETVIIGIQPKEYGAWGETLSPEVANGLDEMVKAALVQIGEWGIRSMPVATR